MWKVRESDLGLHMSEPKLVTHFVKTNGLFPNNPALPLLHYKGVFSLATAEVVEEILQKNNWKPRWRDGIYTFHHYHSNTHEFLGVYAGTCDVQIGGENGEVVPIEKGDALLIPAGVSHKNVGSSADFKCVGAYPTAIEFDMNYGKASEFSQAIAKIEKVPLPKTDPISGGRKPLLDHWK